MNISYYAVFQYDSDGICISFPDVPSALTCADNEEDAMKYAEEVLDLALYGMSLEELPPKTSINGIPLKKNQKLVHITITMQIKAGKLFNPRVIEFN